MRPAIQRTSELLRVVGLPRRKLDLKEATYLAGELTAMLALDRREALRPWQGQILHEMITCRGVYAGAPVGLGKTLLGWLAPVVLDAERPMLIIPGGLRPDTIKFHQSYLHKWRRCDHGLRVVSVDELTRVENVDLLERERPDLIIIDEADTLRNPKASAVRRIGRYVGEFEPMVCAWTGSPGRLSICDLAHILVWCLKDGAPVPVKPGEYETWGAAIDEAPGWGRGGRPAIGALSDLGGGHTIEGARAAFRARLTETPGVIMVDGDSCDQEIHIAQRPAPPDPKLEPHFKTFRRKHVTPDGWPTSDALSIYRHSGELGTGMYLRWDPRPPDWWYGPRKTFCSFVREVIDRDEGLDTELAVARHYADDPNVSDWLAIKKKFIPNSVPVWLSNSVLRDVTEWLASSPHPAIIWTWNVAFGEALSAMTKLRYYGAGGRTATGAHISELSCYGEGPHAPGSVPSIILSGQANMRGRNLQAWRRNGLVNPPRSARFLEQTFGRTHRSGQLFGVEFVFFMTSGDTYDGFDSSVREAEFGKSVFGLTQKLLRANIVYQGVPAPQLEAEPFRWAVGDDEDD